MSVPKQWTNQKIPEAGQALQLLFTVASWHGNCFIWRQRTVLFDGDGYILYHVDLYLSLPHIWPCFWVVGLSACTCMQMLSVICLHITSELLPLACLLSKSEKLEESKQGNKDLLRKLFAGTIQHLLTLRCPPPTFLTPTPKKMCHLEMDYGWEKERKKRKQLVIDFKESV